MIARNSYHRSHILFGSVCCARLRLKTDSLPTVLLLVSKPLGWIHYCYWRSIKVSMSDVLIFTNCSRFWCVVCTLQQGVHQDTFKNSKTVKGMSMPF